MSLAETECHGQTAIYVTCRDLMPWMQIESIGTEISFPWVTERYNALDIEKFDAICNKVIQVMCKEN